MTPIPELLSDFVSFQTYGYFGVEGGQECYCGDDYSKYNQTDGCTFECNGNNSQICGGDWVVSVYEGCK